MIWFAMTAGYHPAAGMSVLGEIVERVSGVPYERYVRDRIFEPVGAPDCWIGMPEPRYEAYGDRIGYMHNTTGAEPVVLRRINSALGGHADARSTSTWAWPHMEISAG